ncbi:DUF397 domain-containing protein [Nocardia carnea]|uniref:DUF397 domain-containing protein n=1 Tax=Nocardia carnea TaxID=37328 RepID=UPI002458E19B|nr:DUF397 domain-containing protein [Nocardia carnea]
MHDLSSVNWFKSSYSTGTKDCVEIAHLDDGAVGVRDSKNPGAGVLVISPTEWKAFVAATKRR